MLRWHSRVVVAAGSFPNGHPTGGDDRPATSARPPGYGHPLLRLGSDVLHILRSGVTADTSVSLHRRRRLSDRVPFLPLRHSAASSPPDTSRVPRPHRARWADDHDRCPHLQLVLHSRAGHSAGTGTVLAKVVSAAYPLADIVL